MDTTSIAAALRREAEAEATRIVSEAEAEAARIVKEKRQKLDTILHDAEVRAGETRNKIHDITMSRAKTQIRNHRLNKIRKLIDESFIEALEKLSRAPEKSRQEQCKKLIALAQRQAPIETVYTPESISGVKVSVVKSETPGVVATTKDGRITVDLTYGAILSTIKQEKFEEILKIIEKH